MTFLFSTEIFTASALKNIIPLIFPTPNKHPKHFKHALIHLRISEARTSQFSCYFIPRVSKMGNQLPADFFPPLPTFSPLNLVSINSLSYLTLGFHGALVCGLLAHVVCLNVKKWNWKALWRCTSFGLSKPFSLRSKCFLILVQFNKNKGRNCEMWRDKNSDWVNSNHFWVGFLVTYKEKIDFCILKSSLFLKIEISNFS